MFFYSSKLIWMLIRPLNFIMALAALGFITRKTSFKRTSKYSAILAVTLFGIFSFTQLPDLLLKTLENKYPIAKIETAPFGAIVLGGGISAGGNDADTQWQLWGAADRIAEGLKLKQKFPSMKMIYSGGNPALISKGGAEADAAKALINDLYGNDRDFQFETKSRNTAENVAYTKTLIGKDIDKEWLLVTSAYHMPRAVAVFEKSGFKVKPAPTDYISRKIRFPYITADSVIQLEKSELLVKELVGLLGYWVGGKI